MIYPVLYGFVFGPDEIGENILLGVTDYGETYDRITLFFSPRLPTKAITDAINHEHVHITLESIDKDDASECYDDIAVGITDEEFYILDRSEEKTNESIHN